MRKSIIFIAFILFYSQIQSQDLTGNWYSADSTRLYEIKRVSGKEYNVFIRSSSRITDKIGFSVIRELEYNARKKRYEGFMYSPYESIPVFVKIRFRKNDQNRIRLQAERMFFFDVAMHWTRANITTAVN